jgi:hypothetical protein
VSPIRKDNFVNLLFRTACEPDVVRYEIYRRIEPGTPGFLVGTVNSDDVPPRSGGYGESPIRYRVREYDHATFADRTAPVETTCYYKVRAVDAAGQTGPFSEEVSVRTKPAYQPVCKVSAQSVYAPQFEADSALDGGTDPSQAWISKPYGGGTKEQPLDVWWAAEFPEPATQVAGVAIIGDHRSEIPLQTALQVQVRENGAWKTIAAVKGARDRDLTITFPGTRSLTELRIFVPAEDLPKSERAGMAGIVRICELELVLSDGARVNPVNLFPLGRTH